MLRTQQSEFLKEIISVITSGKTSGLIKVLPMIIWYGCLMHTNYHLIDKLESMGVFIDNLFTSLCDICVQGKAKKHVFKQAHRAVTALKLIHTDVSGSIFTIFFSEQYYMIFKNDYISLEKPYFMKMKDETAKCFKKYKNLIENQLDIKIKHL